MHPDEKSIRAGRQIAAQLFDMHESGSRSALERFEEEMSAEDHRNLAAHRHVQLASLIGDIENSPAGAEIRHAVAKQIYAEIAERAMRAALEPHTN